MENQSREQKKEVRRVVLPEGDFAYVNCANCRHGSWDPRKEMVWCGRDREWVSGSSGCSRGEPK